MKVSVAGEMFGVPRKVRRGSVTESEERNLRAEVRGVTLLTVVVVEVGDCGFGPIIVVVTVLSERFVFFCCGERELLLLLLLLLFLLLLLLRLLIVLLLLLF